MGYLFLAIALFSGCVKAYCGKKSSGYVTRNKDAILINSVRMMFCIAISFGILAVQGQIGLLVVDATSLGIGLLSGVSTAVFVASWLISITSGAMVLMDVFLMIGVVVTLLCSYFLFREPIRWTQWIGLGLLFLAVAIMCSYNNSIKKKITVGSLLLMVVCGVCSGIADFSQKLFVKMIPGGSATVFNFYTFLFSAATLLVLYGCFAVHDKKAQVVVEHSPGWILKKILPYVFAMAVALFANTFFKTLAAGYLNAAEMYPLNQGCALILSGIMASVIFKEKLTVKGIIGLCLAFVSLLVINVL